MLTCVGLLSVAPAILIAIWFDFELKFVGSSIDCLSKMRAFTEVLAHGDGRFFRI